MKKMMLGCAVVAVLVAGWTGCDTLQPATEDQNLTQSVIERLYQDKLVGRQVLGVTVQNGVATMRGSITDEGLRARAKSIVQSTPGVVEVKDQTFRR
jgi:osmotically-inducible protein OsmY